MRTILSGCSARVHLPAKRLAGELDYLSSSCSEVMYATPQVMKFDRCSKALWTFNKHWRQAKSLQFIIAPHLDYYLPVWGRLPKTSVDHKEHCILRILHCISKDPSACFLKTTFSQLGLQTFQHVTAVRCCVWILTAHQQNSLKDILQRDDSACSSSQTRARSDGAQNLRTVIPKRRADDLFSNNGTIYLEGSPQYN